MRRSVPAWYSAALLAVLLAVSACSSPRVSPASAPAPAQPEPEELGESVGVVEEEVSAPTRDILGDVSYDLPLEANSWVEKELDFLVGQRREVIARWLERGDFYEEYIKEVLRASGVPTDLYHLAMIESGFIPTARSRAGAVGLWQFMPATGRGMGLRVDSLVDERMDPVRSTRAAARHLRDLRRSMGDWALAAAAYNAGSGRISRGLRKFEASDFWDLAQRGDLAEETKHYVPRLYAVTVIARGRDRFGFPSPGGRARFAYDSIQVEYATPLEELARMGEATAEQLTRLNPHLLRGITPAGGYWVWVPAGQGPALQRAYLASDFRKEQGYGTYVVRKGDSLGRLAELSGVRSSRIRELNPKVDFDPLKIGQRLRLPFRTAQELSARPVEKEKEKAKETEVLAGEVSPGGKEEKQGAGKEHEVRGGETLWEIARKHGVTVEALQKSNGIDGAHIRPGMTLRIPGEGRVAETPSTVVEAAEHVVQSGETLWGIAQKYGTSVDAIQEANQLGSRPIQPGQKLSVPR